MFENSGEETASTGEETCERLLDSVMLEFALAVGSVTRLSGRTSTEGFFNSFEFEGIIGSVFMRFRSWFLASSLSWYAMFSRLRSSALTLLKVSSSSVVFRSFCLNSSALCNSKKKGTLIGVWKICAEGGSQGSTFDMKCESCFMHNDDDHWVHVHGTAMKLEPNIKQC